MTTKRRRTVTPWHVAQAAEQIARAEFAVWNLRDDSAASALPSLRTRQLQHLADQLANSRRELLVVAGG